MSAASPPEQAKEEPGAPVDSSIANELIRARTERGFSQAHLSELSKVSRSAIKGYETGRNMPGARELRALCIALNVTPNRLLFGSDAPLLAGSEADRISAALRADPEDKAVARGRLAAVFDLLTNDEAKALALLVRSLAVARHGADRVDQAILGADMLAALMRTMLDESAKAAAPGAPPIDPAKAAKAVEDFLDRQGHKPKR